MNKSYVGNGNISTVVNISNFEDFFIIFINYWCAVAVYKFCQIKLQNRYVLNIHYAVSVNITGLNNRKLCCERSRIIILSDYSSRSNTCFLIIFKSNTIKRRISAGRRMKVLFGRSLCSIAHKPRQTPKFWRVFSRLSQTNHTHKSLVLMFF